MPEHFNIFFYREDKNAVLLRITCIYWLSAKLLTWRIWTVNRILPTAPVFEFLDKVPGIIHTGLFVLSCSLMALSLLNSNRQLLIALLVTEILSCLLDQNRLVPWEYFYVFIIFVFIANPNTSGIIPISIALILISTYCYAGLCKLNQGFLDIVWSKMILKYFLKVPPKIIEKKWIYYCGYLLVAAEIVGGIGLLFVKTQKRSAIALIVMHVFILLLFSPLGFVGYRVLWPWNISMALLLYFIFLHKKDPPISNFLSMSKGWNKLVILCWVILPAASFWGYWDRNLSSNLFSANLPKMIICIADTSKCKELQRFCSRNNNPSICDGFAKIDIQTWPFVESGVAAYPEIRTYRAIQKKLEKKYAAAGLNFIYLDR